MFVIMRRFSIALCIAVCGVYCVMFAYSRYELLPVTCPEDFAILGDFVWTHDVDSGTASCSRRMTRSELKAFFLILEEKGYVRTRDFPNEFSFERIEKKVFKHLKIVSVGKEMYVFTIRETLVSSENK